jgi:uncharacterized membrane protein YgdD (TMEM256/DUF423 family)
VSPFGFVGLGAISAFIGVAAGAFGAHALKERLAPDLLEVWRTAALYQLVHALGMILAGLAATQRPTGSIAAAGWALLLGTVLFSGSLYVLALSGVRWLGAITPFGGLAFLAGWALLAWGSLRG